jgi:hypothetical protein
MQANSVGIKRTCTMEIGSSLLVQLALRSTVGVFGDFARGLRDDH